MVTVPSTVSHVPACMLVGTEEWREGRDEVSVVDDAEVVFHSAV